MPLCHSEVGFTHYHSEEPKLIKLSWSIWWSLVLSALILCDESYFEEMKYIKELLLFYKLISLSIGVMTRNIRWEASPGLLTYLKHTKRMRQGLPRKEMLQFVLTEKRIQTQPMRKGRSEKNMGITRTLLWEGTGSQLEPKTQCFRKKVDGEI